MATPTRKERRFLPRPEGWGLRAADAMKRLERVSRGFTVLLITREHGGLRGMRRFMAIGFVVALALLTAEIMVVYASALPGFMASSSAGSQDSQDMVAPLSTQSGNI